MLTHFFFNHFDGMMLPEALSLSIDQSFEGLAEDPWYAIQGARRFRAMSKFRFTPEEWSRIPDQSFYQSTKVNQYNGGLLRRFEPISDVVPPEFLFSVAQRQARKLGIEAGRWDVNVHQIRLQTTTATDAEAFATPEGIHQDGHDFIGMLLWQRSNAVGASSRVYDRDRTLLNEATLERRGEGLLCNDREVFHAVTPFHSSAPAIPATRDVFIFDWNQATS